MANVVAILKSGLAAKNELESQRVISLSTDRQTTTPWVRRVAGLFVVMWLNLVFQPYAMALGGGTEQDCPRCPSALTHRHAGHDMDTHDRASGDGPCTTGVTNCGVLDDFTCDGRVARLRLKDAPDDTPLATNAFDSLLPATRSVGLVVLPPTRSYLPGNSLPLNVLYCVYLN